MPTDTRTKAQVSLGLWIWNEIIFPHAETVQQAAQALRLNRVTLTAVLNGWNGISPQMAWRLAKVYGADPFDLLKRQAECDLEEALPKVRSLRLRPVVRPKPVPMNPMDLTETTEELVPA